MLPRTQLQLPRRPTTGFTAAQLGSNYNLTSSQSLPTIKQWSAVAPLKNVYSDVYDGVNRASLRPLTGQRSTAWLTRGPPVPRVAVPMLSPRQEAQPPRRIGFKHAHLELAPLNNNVQPLLVSTSMRPLPHLSRAAPLHSIYY